MDNESAEANEPKWTVILREIGEGSELATTELYHRLRGFRSYFRHQIGQQDASDLYHELICDLVVQIRRGAIRDPDRILGYTKVIARRKIVAWIETRSVERLQKDITYFVNVRDGRQSPESAAIQSEYRDIAAKMLRALPKRDREVLIRFYVNEELPERIEADMGLTLTQFRLIKSRAKARFSNLYLARMAKRPPAMEGGSSSPGQLLSA